MTGFHDNKIINSPLSSHWWEVLLGKCTMWVFHTHGCRHFFPIASWCNPRWLSLMEGEMGEAQKKWRDTGREAAGGISLGWAGGRAAWRNGESVVGSGGWGSLGRRVSKPGLSHRWPMWRTWALSRSLEDAGWRRSRGEWFRAFKAMPAPRRGVWNTDRWRAGNLPCCGKFPKAISEQWLAPTGELGTTGAAFTSHQLLHLWAVKQTDRSCCQMLSWGSIRVASGDTWGLVPNPWLMWEEAFKQG